MLAAAAAARRANEASRIQEQIRKREANGHPYAKAQPKAKARSVAPRVGGPAMANRVVNPYIRQPQHMPTRATPKRWSAQLKEAVKIASDLNLLKTAQLGLAKLAESKSAATQDSWVGQYTVSHKKKQSLH